MSNKQIKTPPVPKGMNLARAWMLYCLCEADRQAMESDMKILVDEMRNDYHEFQSFLRQLFFDLTCIILADDFDFRYEKLQKYNDKFQKLWYEYADMWNDDNPDMEYSYDDLDRALKAAIGEEHVVPYAERYEGYMFRNRKGNPYEH